MKRKLLKPLAVDLYSFVVFKVWMWKQRSNHQIRYGIGYNKIFACLFLYNAFLRWTDSQWQTLKQFLSQCESQREGHTEFMLFFTSWEPACMCCVHSSTAALPYSTYRIAYQFVWSDRSVSKAHVCTHDPSLNIKYPFLQQHGRRPESKPPRLSK